MIADKNEINKEISFKIVKRKLIDQHSGLTGTAQLWKMYGKERNLYFVCYCRNSEIPAGKYYEHIGQARFMLEIYKRKII